MAWNNTYTYTGVFGHEYEPARNGYFHHERGGYYHNYHESDSYAHHYHHVDPHHHEHRDHNAEYDHHAARHYSGNKGHHHTTYSHHSGSHVSNPNVEHRKHESGHHVQHPTYIHHHEGSTHNKQKPGNTLPKGPVVKNGGKPTKRTTTGHTPPTPAKNPVNPGTGVGTRPPHGTPETPHSVTPSPKPKPQTGVAPPHHGIEFGIGNPPTQYAPNPAANQPTELSANHAYAALHSGKAYSSYDTAEHNPQGQNPVPSAVSHFLDNLRNSVTPVNQETPAQKQNDWAYQLGKTVVEGVKSWIPQPTTSSNPKYNEWDYPIKELGQWEVDKLRQIGIDPQF